MIKFVAILVTCSVVAVLSANESEGTLMKPSPIGHMIYVSPSGDDSNSGSKEQPLQTIAAARDMAATFLKKRPDYAKSVQVELQAGTYSQTEPLVFTPKHSGRKNAWIIYSAAKGERMAISSGRKITGSRTKVPGKDTVCEYLDTKIKENRFHKSNSQRRVMRIKDYKGLLESANKVRDRYKNAITVLLREGKI